MAYEKIDEKIINELLKNARMSLREIAEELDTSVTTVSNHLEEMQEDGRIIKYKPDIDYAKFGYPVTAIVQLKVEGQGLSDVTETLSEIDAFVDVYEVTGDKDIICVGKFKDTDDMNQTVKKLQQNESVTDSNTSVVLNTAKENELFALPVE